MKNKKATYILIPLVSLVWIILGYKIYIKFVGEENAEVVVVDSNGTENKKTEGENFSLIADYRDPFLGNLVRQIEVTPPLSSVAPKPEPTPPIPKPVIRWPLINVGGTVNHKALILLGNRRVIMAEGQEEMGVKLIQMAKDSVVLKYQGEVKSFVINK